ncbi:MAG TPA: TOBE domain-containing protein [Planctomycetota bacterium]|nr:TOBE domain-containing protein [Planctomycetota bacterium]
MNRFQATVQRCDAVDTVAWLRISGGLLAARLWPGVRKGQRVVVGIRPEDVLLASGHPGTISARNVLPGYVSALQRVPEGVYVTVNVGFPLVSMITRGSQQRLRLERGSALYAILKATAIVPETPSRKRYKVTLVGRKGDVPPEKLKFLRAVDRMGSMSGACRELRITYRTAWLWVKSINRAWGSPLVQRVHGGNGGGGTTLTPEGRAALEYADSLRDRGRDAAAPRSARPRGGP